jgi:Ca-activated chloride channel family protein
MMELAYPWVLLFLPLPLLIWWLVPARRESRAALGVPFLDRLAKLSGQSPEDGAIVPRARRFQFICAIIFWCSLIAALTRPQWIEPPITRSVPVRDMLLAVDLSGSMETKDFTNASGVEVEKLTAVKEILDDFLSHRQGDRVGLIVFGSAPFVQAPFTQDISVCRELLSQMQVNMAGSQTAFGDALGLAINVFDRSPVKERVLIALTDGNDTASEVPPVKAAEIARDKGIVIHTVAVGDPRAAGEEKLDEETLKQVSKTTGGLYSHADNRSQLQAIYDKLNAMETRKADTISHRLRRDLYFWPLGIGFIVSMLPYLRQLLPERQVVSAEPSIATAVRSAA